MNNMNMVERFIINEYRDALLFRNLMELANTKQERAYLERFAQEDKRHVELLQELYLHTTHRNFVPRLEPIKIVEKDFYKILTDQIGSKSENYKAYESEASRSDNSFYKNLLNEMKIDENTHAHKLSELLNLHLLSANAQQREEKHENVLYTLADKKCDEAEMYSQMQGAWEQHVWWTRSLIVSIADSLADRGAVTARLLRNPADIAKLYYRFYGKEAGAVVQSLITEHLKIGGDIVQAAKDGRKDAVDALEKKWYRNADDIVAALTKLNPFYDKMALQKMFYEHLQMTTDQAVQYLDGSYEQSILIFDNIEQEALKMGDFLVDGLIKQFCK